MLAHKRWLALAIAPLLFASGIAALLWSNQVRFGAPLEFGHNENVQNMPLSLRVTRFDNMPPAGSTVGRAGELAGAFLLPGQHARGQFFRDDAHKLQYKPLTPLREFYFQPVPLWLLLGALVGVFTARRTLRHSKPAIATQARILLTFGAVPFFVLFLFYMSTPALTSRYLVDFLPAVSALCGLAVLTAFRVINTRRAQCTTPAPSLSTKYAAGVAVAVLIVSCLLSSAGRQPPTLGVADAAASAHFLQWTTPARALIPVSSYELITPNTLATLDPSLPSPTDAPAEVGNNGLLLYNGLGWDLRSGLIAPATLFWLHDPRFVRVTLSHADTLSAQQVRVRIGPYALRQTNLQDLGGGQMQIDFEVPTAVAHGYQIAFFAFGNNLPAEGLQSNYHLTSVRWKE